MWTKIYEDNDDDDDGGGSNDSVCNMHAIKCTQRDINNNTI